MKRKKMGLPMLKKCCGCLPLESGCIVLCLLSIVICIADITFGAWHLPVHRSRKPEDNLISMSMVMFSTLSFISNVVALAGIYMRRPGYLQMSILLNSVFIVCLFLVAVVTCLFSTEWTEFLQSPGNIALVVIMHAIGAGYSLYYLIVVNSTYTKMKLGYEDSAIPI